MSDLPFKLVVCHCTKFPLLAAVEDDEDDAPDEATGAFAADADTAELEEDDMEVGADSDAARLRRRFCDAVGNGNGNDAFGNEDEDDAA